MKQGLIGLLSLLLIAVMAGCGGAPEPAPSDEGDTTEASTSKKAEGSGTVVEAPAEAPAAAPEETPAPEVVPAAAETPAPEVAPAPAEPAMDGLVGTSWTYNEIALTFKESNKVFLKGGPLAALAPDGTDAEYTLKDGALEVTVMGETYSGTFADGALTVDGVAAVKSK